MKESDKWRAGRGDTSEDYATPRVAICAHAPAAVRRDGMRPAPARAIAKRRKQEPDGARDGRSAAEMPMENARVARATFRAKKDADGLGDH